MESDLLNILVEFIVPSINIGPMLIQCMLHPDCKGCAKELYEFHGDFWTTTVCYSAVCICVILDEHKFWIKKFRGYQFLKASAVAASCFAV